MNFTHRLVVLGEKTLSDISGLYFEMDATKPASFYSDSAMTTLAVPAGPVGGVKDVSSAKLGITGTQTTTTAKPTYTLDAINGRPALYLDGGDWLAVDALAPYVSGSDKPFSVALAYKLDSVAIVQSLFSFDNNTAANPVDAIQLTTTTYTLGRRDDGGATNSPTGGVETTNPHILVMLFSGTTATLIRDGVTIINEGSRNVGTITLNNCTLGALRPANSPTQYMLGYIGQLAVWPTRRIANDEASWVTRTLGQKWGVQVS